MLIAKKLTAPLATALLFSIACGNGGSNSETTAQAAPNPQPLLPDAGRQGVLTGRAVDMATNQPLADVEITAQLKPKMIVLTAIKPNYPFLTTRTGADGSFSMQGLPAEIPILIVSQPLANGRVYQTQFSKEITLTAALPTQQVDLAFEAVPQSSGVKGQRFQGERPEFLASHQGWVIDRSVILAKKIKLDSGEEKIITVRHEKLDKDRPWEIPTVPPGDYILQMGLYADNKEIQSSAVGYQQQLHITLKPGEVVDVDEYQTKSFSLQGVTSLWKEDLRAFGLSGKDNKGGIGWTGKLMVGKALEERAVDGKNYIANGISIQANRPEGGKIDIGHEFFTVPGSASPILFYDKELKAFGKVKTYQGLPDSAKNGDYGTLATITFENKENGKQVSLQISWKMGAHKNTIQSSVLRFYYRWNSAGIPGYFWTEDYQLDADGKIIAGEYHTRSVEDRPEETEVTLEYKTS